MIFWIDHNNFSNKLLEKVFKKAQISFYTIETVSNFAYLINDLKPQVIVLDFQTFEKDKHLFQEQIFHNPCLQSTPFIIIGNGEVPNISIIGRISRPFDPFDIPDKIRDFLKGH